MKPAGVYIHIPFCRSRCSYCDFATGMYNAETAERYIRVLTSDYLDVTDPEPLPKGNPLWKFSNVVITPHTSGGSDQLQARTNALDKENIRRFGAGLPRARPPPKPPTSPKTPW